MRILRTRFLARAGGPTEAHLDRPFGAIELRPRLGAPQPAAKARAADRPSLAVPVNDEIGISRPGRGVHDGLIYLDLNG